MLRAKHALFDRLVYGKLRAALGGDCRAAISGGAPLGARLGHFYRGVGLTIYEGYGLTETSAAITVNRVGDIKVGSVGKLLPGNSMRIGDDGELLVKGGVVFSGYWHNEEETDAVFSDGWFHTGDLGAIDERRLPDHHRPQEGDHRHRGRQERRARGARGPAARASADQSGDGRRRRASRSSRALITIDPEAFAGWKERNGKDAGASVGDLADDPDLVAEIDLAVKEANQAVSKAEAIRKFRILPVDFTEDTGELTPTMKVKRKVVAEKFATDIEALYESGLEQSGQPRGLGVPLPVVDDPAPPRRPHRGGPVGVGEQVADRRGDRADVPAVDDQSRSRRRAPFPARRRTGRPPPAPRSPMPPGRRCPAPRRRGPAPRVRHGIANTSAIAWWAGSSSAGTPPVNTTWSATPMPCGQLLEGVPVRAAADDHQRRRRATRRRIAGSARISMSWPLRGTSRDTHDHHGPVAQAVAGAQFGARGRVGCEPVGVHARRQVLECGVRAERRGEPAPGVAG